MVGVHAASSQFALQGRIPGLNGAACPRSKSLEQESIEESLEHGSLRAWDYDGALAGLAKGYLVAFTKIADAIEVTEKIERPGLGTRGSRQRASPDARSVISANGLAILIRLDQLEPHGAYTRAEIERFDIQQVHYDSSDALPAKFFWNSGVCFRTSSQSKNASGVSSQIANQCPISSFSARLAGSTL